MSAARLRVSLRVLAPRWPRPARRIALPISTALLVAAVLFFGGLFIGAITFGEFLIRTP